jgi:hypothetical protein
MFCSRAEMLIIQDQDRSKYNKLIHSSLVVHYTFGSVYFSSESHRFSSIAESLKTQVWGGESLSCVEMEQVRAHRKKPVWSSGILLIKTTKSLIRETRSIRRGNREVITLLIRGGDFKIEGV